MALTKNYEISYILSGFFITKGAMYEYKPELMQYEDIGVSTYVESNISPEKGNNFIKCVFC